MLRRVVEGRQLPKFIGKESRENVFSGGDEEKEEEEV